MRRFALAVSVVLLSLLVAAPRSSASTNIFYSIPFYGAGDTPIAVVLGDFNGDGKLDIATANVNGGNVSILLNNGDGTFGAAVDYSGGGYLTSYLAVGDFNQDGKLDLAVANGGTNQENNYNLGILLGNGDGTFQPAVNYLVQAGTNFVATGDFNGDGNLDLAVTNATADSLSVLMGRGDGTFSPAVNYTVGPNLSWIVVGDLNGDGKPDLVVAQAAYMGTSQLSVFLNTGNGTFKQGWTFATAIDMGSLSLADFDGDGKLDLLIADDYANSTFSLFRGLGNGKFGSPVVHNIGFPTFSIAVQDVNGDGHPDLICSTEPGFSVVLGNGDGTFQPATSYGGIGSPGRLASGDLDGNGKFDVVESDSFNDVAVVLANSNGSFPAPAAYPLKTFNTGFAAVGDFNNDGRLDITYGTGTLLGRGDGTFRQGPAYASGVGPIAAVVADFNRDGNMDLAVADQYSTQGLDVLLGNGDGSFQPATKYAVAASSSVAAADFNNDGKLDLAVTNPATNLASVRVLLGNGDGTFNSGSVLKIPRSPTTVVTGDFNGDGNQDLAVTSSKLNILLGNGDGTFQAPKTMPVTGYCMTAVDLNGDGKLDLVIGGYFGGTTVLLGNGDGTFREASSQTGGGGSYATTADLNGDGLPDVLMSSVAYPNGNFSVLLGTGTGTLQPGVSYPIGLYAYPVAVGDFNGDGAPDAALPSAANPNDAAMIVELNLAGSAVRLSSSSSPSKPGQPVTLTAAVSASLPNRPEPTGTVTFADGSQVLGTAAVVSGTAMFTTSGLSPGIHSITAGYCGDTNFNPLVSAPLTQEVKSQ